METRFEKAVKRQYRKLNLSFTAIHNKQSRIINNYNKKDFFDNIKSQAIDAEFIELSLGMDVEDWIPPYDVATRKED